MRALITVLALCLVAFSGVAAHAAETFGWCGGAYSETEGGSNFAQCVEGVSAMVRAEIPDGSLTELFTELNIQAGGD